jgi:uncharacterized membrane protein
MNDTFSNAAGQVQPDPGLVTLTHVVYGLHAFSALTGLASAAFVVTAFLSGWPSILAVIINYVKRGEAHGTYLESHFRWQIRTFWFALLWVVVCWIIAFTLFGIPVAIAMALLVGLWVLYRIARGWITLSSDKPMPI